MNPVDIQAKNRILQHHKPSMSESDLDYCINVAHRLLDEVLNKHYYPMLTDEQLEHIMSEQIARTVSYSDYFKIASVPPFVKSIERHLEEYYFDNYIIQLNDESSAYSNIIRYMCELFTNIM